MPCPLQTKLSSFVHLIKLAPLSIIVLLLIYPAESLAAAVNGVKIWWDILFPALFPFLVIAELMLGFGVVHFFGTMLDPLMRPLFRVPGIGGFVLTLGFASGYPVGARLTASLREQNLITRTEGERLISFTTTSDPIFLIGAVSVGFFHNPGIALVLAISHYGAALLVGFIMRFIGNKAPRDELSVTPGAIAVPMQEQSASKNIMFRSLQAMHRARLADGRPLGTLLGQAITNSLYLVMLIGGLVVFFSVLIEIMTSAQMMSILQRTVQSVFQWFAIPPELSNAVVNGIFEVTLGAKAAGAAAASSIPLVSKVAIAALIISWGGLSVHAQIASLLHKTDLRYSPFLFARIIHALLSCFIVFIAWDMLMPYSDSLAAIMPVFDESRPVFMFGGLVKISVMITAALFGFLLVIYIAYTLSKLAIKLWRDNKS